MTCRGWWLIFTSFGREELRNIEDQLSAERSRHLEVQRSTANALAERDDHVTRLLECVSELHTALERAQKMTILVRASIVVPNGPVL